MMPFDMSMSLLVPWGSCTACIPTYLSTDQLTALRDIAETPHLETSKPWVIEIAQEIAQVRT